MNTSLFNSRRFKLGSIPLLWTQLLLLAGVLTLTSCQDSFQKTPFSNDGPSVVKLLAQIDELKLEIQQKLIFKKVSQSSKTQVSLLLNQIRILLLASQIQWNREMLIQLHDLTHQIDAVELPPKEVAQLGPLIFGLKTHLFTLSQKLNIKLNHTPWSLYSYDFGGGLFPFSSYSKDAKWITDFSTTGDHTYAAIKQGPSAVKSWLLSPSFDLSKLDSAYLQLRHSLSISRAEDGFDRRSILQNSFKIFVFSNLGSRNPNEKLGTQLTLPQWPGSSDFQVIRSPLVDLTAHLGSRVQIGLLFDFDTSIHGFHFVKWQISQFILKGQGPPPEYIPPMRKVFDEDFSNGLGDFKNWQNLSPTGAPAPLWEAYSCCGGRRSFAVTHSRGDERSLDTTAPNLLTDDFNTVDFVSSDQRNNPTHHHVNTVFAPLVDHKPDFQDTTTPQKSWLVSPIFELDPAASYALEFKHGVRLQTDKLGIRKSLRHKIQLLYTWSNNESDLSDLDQVNQWQAIKFIPIEFSQRLALNQWTSLMPKLALPKDKGTFLRFAFVFTSSLENRYSWQIEHIKLWKSDTKESSATLESRDISESNL